MVRQTFLIIALALFLPISALAADISVKPDRSPVSQNETFRLIFTVQGKQDGEPDFSPLNKDFQLLGTSTSSQFNMINGRVSQSKQYVLTVAANRTGKLVIPSIQFGKDRSLATEVTITDSPVSTGQGSDPSTDPVPAHNVFVEASVDSSQPYVQQQVILTVKVFRNIQWADANLSDPAFDGGEMLIHHIGENRTYKTMRNGERYTVTEIRYAIFPQVSGKTTIKPFTLTAKLPSGKKQTQKPFGNAFSDPIFDDFFTRQNYTNRFARSEPIEIDVKAVPKSFTGKTWLPAKTLKLQETWSQDTNALKTGEPVTRTIAIIADGLNAGQLPEIRLDSLNSIKVYPDQPVINDVAANQGFLSTRSQKFALIPSQQGKQILPEIKIHWWNTETNQQETAILPAATLDISAAAAAIPRSAQAPAESGTSKPAGEGAGKQEQPAKTSPPRQKSDTSGRTWWLIAGNVLLLLLLVLTLFALLRAKKQAKVPVSAHEPTTETTTETSKQQVIKALQTACRNRDAAATRDALINWAAIIWPEHPPNNLNDIARHVNPELATQILRLNQNLYANDETEWNPELISKQVQAFANKQQNTRKTDEQVLEPLYR
jgi:hypothetical protein